MAALLKIDETAQELTVSKSKVWQWVRTGQLPAVKLDGVLRIRRADLDEFIAALPLRPVSGSVGRTRQTTSGAPR